MIEMFLEAGIQMLDSDGEQQQQRDSPKIPVGSNSPGFIATMNVETNRVTVV